MDKRKAPSISRQHKIDQRAVKIFQNWLPDNWLPREQKLDFYLDFVVEIDEQDEPSGRHFAVQIKGFEQPQAKTKPLAYSFETKHLRYYLNRCQIPVFLFLINVTSGEGYWVFAQGVSVPSEKLHKQKSFTVRFSREDSLANSAKFKCLLPNAERIVRDLHPGSIHAALRKRKADLEAIDPRCSVSVSAEGIAESFNISAKEEFAFSIGGKSADVHGWADFAERGAPVRLNTNDLRIEGAPMLEAIFKPKTGYTIIHHPSECRAWFEFVCQSDEIIPSLRLEAIVTSGTKITTVAAAMPDAPVELSAEIPNDIAFAKDARLSHLAVLLNKWAGKAILSLPFFDQTVALVNVLENGRTLNVRVIMNGNVVWSSECGTTEPKRASNVKDLLDWIKKCRHLAKVFHVNPPIKPFSSITKENWDALSEIHELYCKKEISIPIPDMEISFTTSKPPPDCEINQGTIRIETAGRSFSIFGTQLTTAPIRYVLTAMRTTSIARTPQGGSRCSFKATPESKHVVKLLI